MKLIIIQPNWKTASEVWLMRIIDIFEKNIRYIAAYSPSEFRYKNIDILDLKEIINPRKSLFWGKLAKYIYYPSKSNKLEKILNSSEIDSILVHYLAVAVEYKKYLTTVNKPLFIHCHGFDITWDLRDMKTPEKLFHPKDYISSILELSAKAIFIANSKYTTNKLLEIGVPEHKIKLKYFGVPVPFPKIYKDNETYLNILFLGRLVDFKGPDIVIKAFNLACERGLKAFLIIAGDGPLKITCELLKRRSSYSNKIHLLGEVDVDKADELRRNADIFTAHNCKGLLSHQEEAFGVSIVEAMAAELPVISARSGALEETVLTGETGILVEQFDIENHAEAFLKLSSDQSLRKVMGHKGRERVLKYFSIELEKQRLTEIFNLTTY